MLCSRSIVAFMALALAGCRGAPSNVVPAPLGSAIVAAPTPWATASTGVYEIRLASEVALPNGEKVLVGLEAKARVQIQPTENAEAADVVIGLEAVKATLSDAGASERVSRELESPFGFRMHAGRLQTHRLAEGASAAVFSLQRTIGAAFQVAVQSNPTWNATEWDATGRYVAKYERASDGHFKKWKEKYEAVVLPPLDRAELREQLVPRVEKSVGDVRLEGSRLESAAYDETLVTELQPGAQITSRTSLSLKRVEVSLPAGALVLVRFLELPVEQAYSPQDQPTVERAKRGEYSFDAALAELKTLSQKEAQPAASSSTQKESEVDLRSRGRAFVALAAILRDDVKAVGRAKLQVKRDPATRQLLVDALGSAGSEASQAALTSLANDALLDRRARKRAAYALVRGDNLSVQTIDVLVGWLNSDEFAVHALYGLGTASRKLRAAGEGARSTAIDQVLLRELERAQAPARRAHVLRGMANSGSSIFVEAVAPLFAAEDHGVRSAAGYALHRVPGIQVDTLLTRLLALDAPTSVRLAAVDACSNRHPSDQLVQALSIVATGARDSHSRYGAVKLLTKWIAASAQIRETMDHVKQNDAEALIREAAAEALATAPGASTLAALPG